MASIAEEFTHKDCASKFLVETHCLKFTNLELWQTTI